MSSDITTPDVYLTTTPINPPEPEFEVTVQYGIAPNFTQTESFTVKHLVHIRGQLKALHAARRDCLLVELKKIGFVDFERYAHYLSAKVTVKALSEEANRSIDERYQDPMYVYRDLKTIGSAMVVSSVDRSTAYGTIGHEPLLFGKGTLPGQSDPQSFLTEATFDAYIAGVSKARENAPDLEPIYDILIHDRTSTTGGEDYPTNARMSLMNKQFNLLPYLNNSVGYAKNAAVIAGREYDTSHGLHALTEHPLVVDLTFEHKVKPLEPLARL